MAFDISLSTYSGNSFVVTSQMPEPRALFVSPDGTKMYTVGNTNNTIYQYTLSTPWDISTATYDSVSLDVSSQSPNATHGLFISPDGTELYTNDATTNKIIQYTMSTGWDLSTATFTRSINPSGITTSIRGPNFSLDGKRMYVLEAFTPLVYQYNLSTAWDISTASGGTSTSIASDGIASSTPIISDDGSTMLIVTSSPLTLRQYNLKTPYDVTTKVHVNTFDLSVQSTAIVDISFSKVGEKFYVLDWPNDTIYEYGTNSAWTASDAPGVTWVDQTTAAANAWKSVANGNNRFVAVAYSGTGNRVMTSDNGVDWTIRTSAADNDWYDVCYSDSLGLFVAVARSGTGDRVMTSPNGIDWTLRTSAEDNSWYAVTWSEEKSLFVAVSGNGTNRVMTSPDGINWTARTTPSRNWQGIAYGNGVFAAVGTSNDAMYSSDGITWNVVGIGGGSFVWKDVVWSEDVGLFVAVSNGGDSGGRVATSPDGITWTQRPSANDSYSWTSVTYGAGLFVASSVGLSTYYRIMTSPDGINWTLRSIPLPSLSLYGVTYGNNMFVAVSNAGAGNTIVTSGTFVSSLIAGPVKGRDFLLQIEHPADSGTFVNIGGLTNLSYSITNSSVDETDKYSNGNRELAANAGVASYSLSFDFFYKGAASDAILMSAAHENTQRVFKLITAGEYNYQFTADSVSYERTGAFDGLEGGSVTLESSGAVTAI